MTNDKWRMAKEVQNPNDERTPGVLARPSSLLILSGFVIRYSFVICHLSFVIRTLCLLVLALCALRARAENPASAFEAGNKLYYEGKFAEAAAAYEKLALSSQASPALYFNLGNACFKSGQ